MLLRLAKRLLLESDKRLLFKLAWNMGLKGGLSVLRHKRRKIGYMLVFWSIVVVHAAAWWYWLG